MGRKKGYLQKFYHLTTLLILLGLVFTGSAHAVTYYVDATRGSDQFNGLFESTPFKTIAKVHSLALKPGDQVLFRRGEVWRETLRIRAHGTATQPIIYGAYGAGPTRPIIKGSDVIPGIAWRPHGDGSFSATISSLTLEPQFLFVNGTAYRQARYPKTGFITATATATDKRSILVNRLDLTADQVNGAKVFAKVWPWDFQEKRAIGLAPTGGIVVNSDFTDPMRRDMGFFLSNKLWMMTEGREWVYEPATKTVHIRMLPGESPLTSTIEISTREFGIYTGNNARIQDFEVMHHNFSNIYGIDSQNVTFDRIRSVDSLHGFALLASSNSTHIVGASIINSSIANIARDGITIPGGSNILIDRNTIANVARVGIGFGSSCNVVNCTNVAVTNNHTTNIGSIGIAVSGIRPLIQRNSVAHACRTFDDCGGIYVSSRVFNNPMQFGARILDNQIQNVRGVLLGTSSLNPAGIGIYLDDFSHETLVERNQITNADAGIVIHNGRNNTIRGNRIARAGMRGGIVIGESRFVTAPGQVTHNLVENNNIAVDSNGNGLSLTSIYNHDGSSFGTYRNNQYCHPTAPNHVRLNWGAYLDLTTWQSRTGQDQGSTAKVGNCQTTAAAMPTPSMPPRAL